jgi:hypothetical protein
MTNIIGIETITDEKIMGAFSPKTDVIKYNKQLDKYPTLKKFVIKHELRHQQHKNNVLYHFYNDLIDYTKVRFRRDYWKFIKENEDNFITSEWSKLQVGLMYFFNLLVNLWFSIVLFLSIPYLIYISLVKEEVKPDEKKDNSSN